MINTYSSPRIAEWVSVLGGEYVGPSRIGKSYCLGSHAEKVYAEGAKVIFFETDYMELAAMQWPTRNTGMRKALKSRWGFCPTMKVDYYAPLTFSMEKINAFGSHFKTGELPSNFHPFTIPITTLSNRKFFRILTSDSKSDTSFEILADSLKKMKPSDSLPKAMTSIQEKIGVKWHAVERAGGRMKLAEWKDIKQSASSAISTIDNLMETGVFSSKDFDLNIEKKMEEIILDTQTATSFCFYWLSREAEEKVLAAIIHYLMDLIVTVNMKHKKPVFLVFNDATNYFPSERSSDPAKKILADYVAKLVSEFGKANIHPLISFQKPTQIHHEIRDNLSAKFIFRQTSERKDVVNFYGMLINSSFLKVLPVLRKGRHYVFGFDRIRNLGMRGMLVEGRWTADYREENTNGYYFRGAEAIKVSPFISGLIADWEKSSNYQDFKDLIHAENRKAKMRKMGVGKSSILVEIMNNISPEEALTGSEVAQRLGKDPGTVSQWLKKGTEQGFFEFVEKIEQGKTREVHKKAYKLTQKGCEIASIEAPKEVNNEPQ